MKASISELVNGLCGKKQYDWIKECREENPVYIFGAGSLAKTIIELLHANGINPMGVFVDHKYYKAGAALMDIPVYDWDEFESQDRLAVVMGMSDARRGLEISKRSCIEKVIYPACLSFEKDKLLTYDYIMNNLEILDWIYDKCADHKSREVFESWIQACVTLYTPTIFPFCEAKVGYFNNGLIDFSKIKTYVNFGAYTGDTVEEFLAVTSDYKKIYAMEGDTSLVHMLKKKFSDNEKIQVIERVFWDKIEKVDFSHIEGTNSVGGTAKSLKSETEIGVATDTFDHYVENEWDLNQTVDLISICFRGEENVFRGAKNTIRRDHPVLVAKVGFERDCLYKVMKTIDDIDPSYKYYLRFKDNRIDELSVYAI